MSEICPICEKVTKNLKGLKMHFKAIHPDEVFEDHFITDNEVDLVAPSEQEVEPSELEGSVNVTIEVEDTPEAVEESWTPLPEIEKYKWDSEYLKIGREQLHIFERLVREIYNIDPKKQAHSQVFVTSLMIQEVARAHKVDLPADYIMFCKEIEPKPKQTTTERIKTAKGLADKAGVDPQVLEAILKALTG